MVIISLGLMFLLSTVPLMMSDLTDSGQRTRSTFFAEEFSEFLTGLPYDHADLTAGTHVDTSFNVPGYSRGWTVEDNVPELGVKRITVEVTHTNPKNNSSVVFFHAESGN